MTIEELRKLLNTDIVTVVFTKKNGDSRKMVCTTKQEVLGGEASKFNKPVEGVVTVWDVESNGWRSFRFDTVKSVDTEYFNYVV